ncbi:hypothetical protein CFT85387_06265 [Campylobacter fetus subsp. testudinum]|nr:hypothetical protein CFT12S02847_06925 [Campylobacter fetus subsp. testudinum]OCS00320.1 hypothetical protein CFT85387_06265 [Campylobacter fetus subsp. testudinum]
MDEFISILYPLNLKNISFRQVIYLKLKKSVCSDISNYNVIVAIYIQYSFGLFTFLKVKLSAENRVETKNITPKTNLFIFFSFFVTYINPIDYIIKNFIFKSHIKINLNLSE